MGNDFNEYYLAHHGIKGQKWGVRRYQNKDGSYTSAGKSRYAKYDKGSGSGSKKSSSKSSSKKGRVGKALGAAALGLGAAAAGAYAYSRYKRSKRPRLPGTVTPLLKGPTARRHSRFDRRDAVLDETGKVIKKFRSKKSKGSPLPGSFSTSRRSRRRSGTGKVSAAIRRAGSSIRNRRRRKGSSRNLPAIRR